MGADLEWGTSDLAGEKTYNLQSMVGCYLFIGRVGPLLQAQKVQGGLWIQHLGVVGRNNPAGPFVVLGSHFILNTALTLSGLIFLGQEFKLWAQLF